MTDFDARAREIAPHLLIAAGCVMGQTMTHPEWVAKIAAALKAAYNEGLEDAAKHAEDVEYYRADQHSIAADVRTMKIPT